MTIVHPITPAISQIHEHQINPHVSPPPAALVGPGTLEFATMAEAPFQWEFLFRGVGPTNSPIGTVIDFGYNRYECRDAGSGLEQWHLIVNDSDYSNMFPNGSNYFDPLVYIQCEDQTTDWNWIFLPDFQTPVWGSRMPDPWDDKSLWPAATPCTITLPADVILESVTPVPIYTP